MVFLLGQTLPPQKRVLYALRAFEGVGLATAQRLCDAAAVHAMCRTEELRTEQTDRLKALLEPHLEACRRERLLRLKAEKALPARILPTAKPRAK
jgi:ribosomal protein S13